MNLTDRQVQHAKPAEKDYKLRDRDNMYITITKKGTKYWRLDYRLGGKRKTFTLGKYPELKIKEARSLCQEAKVKISKGIDPNQKNFNSTKKTYNFEDVGNEWFDIKLQDKSKSHRENSKRVLNKHLYPKLKNIAIENITPPILLEIFRSIEDKGMIDTARRAKQTAGYVFDYAISCGYTETNPAIMLNKALKSKEKTHYPSITCPLDVGRLMMDIDYYSGSFIVRTALKLSALFFTRPGELRQLEWSDVNFEEDMIVIPAERMKMKADHIIPISHQAKALLLQIQKITGNKRYIFPSQRGDEKPMSSGTVRSALISLRYDNQIMVPHGFRAMARTLLDEELEFNIVWIEQQLAHVVKDANGRAYNRTKHLRQRREMMQRWADYLDELKAKASGENVIRIA